MSHEPTYEIKALDRSTNLVNPPEVPDKLTVTQTGGLEKRLTVKKDAPIVITSNHHIAKYKEDGIVNGARGYIDSLQVSKKNKEEVEVIWVVFKDKNVGRLLKYEYAHLKKLHKPNSDDAIPILKQKKNFTIHRGEVRYQRTQFPLTLAYAITAYKCQGDTLNEVIIDFSHGPGDRANIQFGSFYVALTRVKEGKNVFLKHFDKSHITFNEKVERKIAAMRQYKAYRFKKTYVSDQVFKESDKEVKLGYFNMRGFLESNHSDYLDNDKNLLGLHLLVISETWLSDKVSNKVVKNKLKNWKIIKRLDATNDKKHMGLMLLAPNDFTNLDELVFDMDYVQGLQNNEELLYQGLVLDLKKIYKKIVCLYIRQTPNKKESLEIRDRFETVDCIMGDLNLNKETQSERLNLLQICGKNKSIALDEITTNKNNQLDHVILDKLMVKNCFTTSFFSLASDHKPIVLRIPYPENPFSTDFLEGIYFDSHHHLKPKEQNQQQKPERIIKPDNMNTKSKSSSKTTIEANRNSEFVILRFVNDIGTNLCFSNAAISCLLNIQEFKNGIQNIEKVFGQLSICEELSRLVNLENFTTTTTENIRTIVKMKCFENGQWTKNFNNNRQHDCGEFIHSLLEHFWNEPIVPLSLRDLVFGGLSQNTLSCPCGIEEKLQIQPLPEIIPIQIKGPSIQSCLDDYLAPENIEWNCPRCSNSTVLKKTSIIMEPNTIILQLLRYNYDEVKHKILKNHGKVNCLDQITLPSGKKYSLISAIIHIGEDTRSGHYQIVLYDGQFTLLDDSEITNSEDFEMKKLAYILIYKKN